MQNENYTETPAQFVSGGSPKTYMGDDGASGIQHLAGHLLNKAIQGVSAGPHPIEDEPVDDAEAASFKTAQNAYRSASQSLQNGTQDGSPAYSFDHAQVAANVRSALRPVI